MSAQQQRKGDIIEAMKVAELINDFNELAGTNYKSFDDIPREVLLTVLIAMLAAERIHESQKVAGLPL